MHLFLFINKNKNNNKMNVIIVKKSDIKIKKILNLMTTSGQKIKNLKNNFYIIFIYNYESINSIYYLLYKEKNEYKIGELSYIEDKHIKPILESISRYFPKDIILWSGIIPQEQYKTYIENDFNHPYKCNKSPLGNKVMNPGIAFIWQKEDIEALDKKSIENTINFLKKVPLSYKNNSKCNIYARFTPEAIKYLKDINSQDTSDIELSGSLLVKKVSYIDGIIVHELYSNPKSVIKGEKETVDAVWSRYNFHTHPIKAYNNNRVKKGWPSSQDYVGFLDLNNNTIFHTVVTIEGLYIISISQEWKGNTEKIDRHFVLEHYNISHNSKHSFQEYVDSVNDIKYKGTRLFVVKFMPWNKASDIFPVFYEKTDNVCLATDKVFDINK